MKYIIDANNLAGKLKMLGDKNFDKKLIEMIKEFTKYKKNEIVIVFDPRDEWGDRVAVNDKIIVVYSPRDNYYQSADDKIVEIVNKFVGAIHESRSRDEIAIITDDMGLKKRIKKITEKIGQNINFIRATEYADKLLKSFKQEEDEKEDLNEEDKDKINKELLNIWQ